MDGPTVAVVPVEEAHGRGVALAVSGKEPVTIAIDANACL